MSHAQSPDNLSVSSAQSTIRRRGLEQAIRARPTFGSSVTRLSASIEQLLESLTQWSQRKIDETAVRDVYVRVGNDFNAVVIAFAAYNIDMSDLSTFPDDLRNVLEQCLAEDPTPENLDICLSTVRPIITKFLQRLRGKQSRRQRSSGSSASATPVIHMSTSDSKSPQVLQTKPPLQANTHIGDRNQNNKGIIGDGSGNLVVPGDYNRVNVAYTQVMGSDELDRLLYRFISKDALHDSWFSPPNCHPNTRITVLKEIQEWVDNPNSSPLLWLNGPAGVGKSVIAKTISGLQDKVIGTFFFSTSSDRSAATLFPTLAWQLARKIPETRSYILDALKSSGALQTCQIEKQFDLFIVQPLKKCLGASCSGKLMIIDGVDECVDESMLKRFLLVLTEAAETHSMPVRFLICSRPEPRIRAILERAHDDPPDSPVSPLMSQNHPGLPEQPPPGMRLRDWSYLIYIKTGFYNLTQWKIQHFTGLSQEICELYRPMQLSVGQSDPSSDISGDLDKICQHPVVSRIQIGLSDESKEDIGRYLEDKFNTIRQPAKNGSSWFRQSDIRELVKRSCGQFLYASTIVRLLDNSHFSPEQVLEMARTSSLPSPDLNKLYKAIVNQAKIAALDYARDVGLDQQEEAGVLMDTLALLIVFEENVHLANMRKTYPLIESLLNLGKDDLSTKLCKMHSVLKIIPGKTISVHHRSFLEFLQDRRRAEEEYYIAYPVALQKFLILLGRTLLINAYRDYHGQPRDDHRKRLACLTGMVLAFPNNFFRLSSSPTILAFLHVLTHYSLTFLFWIPFWQFTRHFWQPRVASFNTPYVAFVVRYVFIALQFLIFAFLSFIISLAYYIASFRRSVVYPFFHPFLHPYFGTTVVLLSSLGPRSFTFLIFACIALVISYSFN